MRETLPLLALDLRQALADRDINPHTFNSADKPGARAFSFVSEPANTNNSVASGPFPPEPFPLLRGASAPPKVSPDNAISRIGTEDDQYSVDATPCDACTRVLCWNPPSGDANTLARVTKHRQDNSLLGINGHLERSCAWTHLLGAIIFLIFATLRPLVGFDVTSTAGILSGITAAILMMTFLVSTTYHTLGTIGDLMPLLRMLDHGSIYIALACAAVTDTAVVTIDFLGVPWQTIVDAVGVAVLLLAFFSYRRLVLPPSETIIAWGSCKLGLFRLAHADKNHSALRSSGYVVLSFGFIALIPAAVNNLPHDMAVVLISCNVVSLLLLVGGLVLDNVLLWPDTWYMEGRLSTPKGRLPSLRCHNTELGCIFTSNRCRVFSTPLPKPPFPNLPC